MKLNSISIVIGPLNEELRIHPRTRDEMYANIVNKHPNYPNTLSNEALLLLKGLLEKDPSKRIGARCGIEEIKETDFSIHPYAQWLIIIA